MSQSNSTRRPARPTKNPPAKLIEARDKLASALQDTGTAAKLLRTMTPLVYDGLPDDTDTHDFAAVAKAAQEYLQAATGALGEISIECKEVMGSGWRTAGAIDTELMHAYDAISCAIFSLKKDFEPGPGEKMAECTPGGAFQCATLVLHANEARLSALLAEVEKQTGKGGAS